MSSANCSLSLQFAYTRFGVHPEHVGNHFDSGLGWLPVLNMHRFAPPTTPFLGASVRKREALDLHALQDSALIL